MKVLLIDDKHKLSTILEYDKYAKATARRTIVREVDRLLREGKNGYISVDDPRFDDTAVMVAVEVVRKESITKV